MTSTHAATLVLNPTKDASIYSERPNNSNGGGSLFAGQIAKQTEVRRAMLAFDLSSLPSYAIITQVSLSLTVTQVATRGPAGPSPFTLHRLLEDWGEGAAVGGGTGLTAVNGDATWNNRFHHTSAPSATPWTVAGGYFVPTLSATGTAELPGDILTFHSNQNSQLLLDALLWQSSPEANFGWLLKGDENTSGSAKVLSSSEPLNSSSPTLFITYAVPEPSRALLTLIGLSAMLFRRRRT